MSETAQERQERLYGPKPAPDGTPVESAYYWHPAMTWEETASQARQFLRDGFIPSSDERWRGLRISGVCSAEIEHHWRMRFLRSYGWMKNDA